MATRKRILFLAPRLPYPPDKGDKIRTWNILRHLTDQHDVHCAAFSESDTDRKHIKKLKSICAETAILPWHKSSALLLGGLALVSGGTVTLAAHRSAPLSQRIAKWGAFDSVYAFSGAMAPYALAATAHRRLLDLCDADSEKWLEYAAQSAGLKRFAYRLEGRRLRRQEIAWLAEGHFDAITVITRRERLILDPTERHDNLHVIANGVESRSAAPRPSASAPTISFIGAMDYPPNIDAVTWFADEIWPGVRKQEPSAMFQVIGRNPTRRVRRLAQIAGVEISGEVPDVGPYLLNSRIVVAPLRIARGLPNKVLEAMAAGRPVVTTSAVAESLHACDGQELLIADQSEDFVDRVVELLRHPRLCDDIGEAAHNFASANHDWGAIAVRFESLLLGSQDHDANESAHFLRNAANAVR